MAITKDKVKKIAKLAKLTFSDDEVESLSKQMKEIMEHVEKINELNLDETSPTFYISENKNPLRKDLMKSWLTEEETLKNAPQKHDGYFSVPKVIKR